MATCRYSRSRAWVITSQGKMYWLHFRIKRTTFHPSHLITFWGKTYNFLTPYFLTFCERPMSFEYFQLKLCGGPNSVHCYEAEFLWRIILGSRCCWLVRHKSTLFASVKWSKIKIKSNIYMSHFSYSCIKCSVRSTLCWKIGNISGSTELFGL